MPFQGGDVMDVLRRNARAVVKFCIPGFDEVSDTMKVTLKLLLNKHPYERLHANEVVLRLSNQLVALRARHDQNSVSGAPPEETVQHNASNNSEWRPEQQLDAAIPELRPVPAAKKPSGLPQGPRRSYFRTLPPTEAESDAKGEACAKESRATEVAAAQTRKGEQDIILRVQKIITPKFPCSAVVFGQPRNARQALTKPCQALIPRGNPAVSLLRSAFRRRPASVDEVSSSADEEQPPPA